MNAKTMNLLQVTFTHPTGFVFIGVGSGGFGLGLVSSW